MGPVIPNNQFPSCWYPAVVGSKTWVSIAVTLTGRNIPASAGKGSMRPETLIYMMTSSNGNIFRVSDHLCGESGEFPTQRPVTRSFDVFFDLRLNKRLNKQSWGWWFETPSCSLWRHCNDLSRPDSIGSASIRHRSVMFTSDRYLIEVEPKSLLSGSFRYLDFLSTKILPDNLLTSFDYIVWLYIYIYIIFEIIRHRYFEGNTSNYIVSFEPGPFFCLLLGVSRDYAQPTTGQVTEVACPVIGQAQPEFTLSKRQKTDLVILSNKRICSSVIVYARHWPGKCYTRNQKWYPVLAICMVQCLFFYEYWQSAILF